MKRKRLGEVLRDRGNISPANLQQVIDDQRGSIPRFGELILERGLVDKPALISALEEVSHVAYMDCSTVTCEADALRIVPQAVAERLIVLPVRLERSQLVVAMTEPQNLVTIDELQFIAGRDISPRMAFRSEILDAIARNYREANVPPPESENPGGDSEEPEDLVDEMEFTSSSSRQSERKELQDGFAELHQKKTPAIRLVSEIIRKAMARQASDIHIEPQDKDTIIRIRVDGVLRELQSVSRLLQNSLISRIKILSDMDIAERRAPQDGRFMASLGTRKVEMRVSTLPTQYGEKIVMRLLETSAPLLTFSELGFPLDISERVSRLLASPQGMLLVTGPTGAGKSSTLYSALNVLRKPAVNIITVEDPVEYVLAGINQVHVNTRAGLTFASCLRSMLRQDPNVIMVGEIRDRETAEIAMKAAQTGHLVLSTLHTNDSISAVARLLDLGTPSYLIASSVSGILAQRLVRKLCVCHTLDRATPEYRARLAEAGWTHPPEKVPRPAGCEICDHSGYKGRVGVYEFLTIDEAIRSIIRTDFQADKILGAARRNGMRSLQENALAKLKDGITTLEEILRVVPFEHMASSECTKCGHGVRPAFHFCPSCGVRIETGMAVPESQAGLAEGVLST